MARETEIDDPDKIVATLEQLEAAKNEATALANRLADEDRLILDSKELLTPRLKAEALLVSRLGEAAACVSYILNTREHGIGSGAGLTAQLKTAQMVFDLARSLAPDKNKGIQRIAVQAHSAQLSAELEKRLSQKLERKRFVNAVAVESSEPKAQADSAADGGRGEGG